MSTLMQYPPGLNALVSSLRASAFSDFYRSRWGSAETFEALPHISRADFIAAPLSTRRYKQEKGMVKIVGTGDAAFLSEWSFADISAETHAPRSARPMVYMSDSYEAIEKAMWCYENGTTPLMGEKDPDLAMFAAGRYRIDSLMTDEQALMKFIPYFSALNEPLESITVFGQRFSPLSLMPFERYARSVRLVLSLPETGAIACAALSPAPVFVPNTNCIIERDSEIVLTKVMPYPTPVIRYRTGIPSDVLR